MSGLPQTRVERSQSPIFRTVATDFYEFWVDPETTRLLFYTQHYVPKEQELYKPINKDTIYRELQVECWMATSMALNMASGILSKHKIRVECPRCKAIIPDLLSHLKDTHEAVMSP